MLLDGRGKEPTFPSPGAAVAPRSPCTSSGGDVPAQRAAPLVKVKPASTVPVSCKSLFTDIHMYIYLISVSGETGQPFKLQYVNRLYKQEAALQQQVIKRLQTNQESGESSEKRGGGGRITPFPPRLAYPKSHVVSFHHRREMCLSENLPEQAVL